MEKHSMLVNRKNIVKMADLTNAIHTFSDIPVKLPMTFLTELEKKKKKNYFKIHMEPKKSQTAKAILNKKNEAKASYSRTSEYNTWPQ